MDSSWIWAHFGLGLAFGSASARFLVASREMGAKGLALLLTSFFWSQYRGSFSKPFRTNLEQGFLKEIGLDEKGGCGSKPSIKYLLGRSPPLMAFRLGGLRGF